MYTLEGSQKRKSEEWLNYRTTQIPQFNSQPKSTAALSGNLMIDVS